MTEEKKAVKSEDEQTRVTDAPVQEGKPQFAVGDEVVVNRGLVATIVTWDEPNNLVVYVANVGGGTDTTTAPISHTDVRLLKGFKVSDVEQRPVQGAPVERKDEVTTYDHFSGA